jgi:hypothetical protein
VMCDVRTSLVATAAHEIKASADGQSRRDRL